MKGRDIVIGMAIGLWLVVMTPGQVAQVTTPLSPVASPPSAAPVTPTVTPSAAEPRPEPARSTVPRVAQGHGSLRGASPSPAGGDLFVVVASAAAIGASALTAMITARQIRRPSRPLR